MTYKQIEASREIRLWIGQVIVPAIGVGIAVASNPNARCYVSNKTEKAKNYIRRKFSKK